MLRSWWMFASATALGVGMIAAGCSGDDSAPSGAQSGQNTDGSVISNDGSLGASDAQVAPSDAGLVDVHVSNPDAGGGTATFAYRPQWSGVTSVSVIGGFGTADDWDVAAPFLTLTDDGTGNWTGSASLPAGQYLYLFSIVGDADGAKPTKYQRFAIDPFETDLAACPDGTPTAHHDPPNPCSELTVGEGPAGPVHIRGVVRLDGNPANGWLVTVGRQENDFHHFFVNRTTAGADGAFDMVVGPGRYHIQVDVPDWLKTDDIDRDPLALDTVREAQSTLFQVTTDDVTLDTPDLGYHDYASFAPTDPDGGTLPTTFAFTKRSSKLDVYCDKGDIDEVGDPCFESNATNKGKYTFDGNFEKGNADAAAPGQRYMWGTEEPVDAGTTSWNLQTLPFPITWH